MTGAGNELAATVRTSQGTYRVLVGSGLITRLGEEVKASGLDGRGFVIGDSALYPASVRAAQDALERAGITSHVMTIPSGEQVKSLDTARHIYAWLARLRAERRDFLVAVGGGVTGDLVGYAAATWLRGVPFVQVPTSLAAMVDASLGGKVAINLPEGKNLVGAFHQPKLVLQDVDFLKTLPPRELNSGWAEAIKHGLILDADLLAMFERDAENLKAMRGERWVDAIRRSVAIKAEVVSSDEFETGETRILLNYGHTTGHALEAVTGYGAFLHGEAVAIGMSAAIRIAHRMGMVAGELVERQDSLLRRFNLPLRAPGVPVDKLLAATRGDKKTRGGAIRWVLLEGPGKATTRRDVPEKLVREVLVEIAG
ncbi:MAG: 3-dehydroquinate synthase [SAR202 cluster bacterium]|nr:3-dehydroquinate synthase [SAR202 cluster bacterium]